MASNPYMQNPLVAGLGALSQGFQLAEQQKTQKAAQQAALQRQAMLDAAKASLDKSQAGNYDASAYESRARADNLGTVAGNTRRQDLMSEIDKVNQRLPDLYTVAVTRGDRSALDQATQYRDYLMSQLQGGVSPQGTPSGIPSSPSQGDYKTPVGGGSYAEQLLRGGRSMPAQPQAPQSGPLTAPSPVGAPAGIPQMTGLPFAQQLQDASKPQPVDVNSLFGGVPKAVTPPAYVPPKPVGGNSLVTPLDGPPQVQGGVTRYPYRAPSGETLYASRQEAAGVIDWAKQQPIQDKIADVELLRKTGKTSENDGWSPYYVKLAQGLTGQTPQEREQQFEAAIARDHMPIVKFPSDSQSYQNFAAQNGVDTGQAPQGIPQAPQGQSAPNIPQAPHQGQGGLTFSPDEQLKMSQGKEADARTQEIKAKIGDPFPFLAMIGQYTQPGAQAVATQQWNESHGTHFGVPGVDFPGTYSLNQEEAQKQLYQQAQTHALNVNSNIAPYKARAEITHMENQDKTSAAAQQATETHYGNQDTLGQNNLDFKRDTTMPKPLAGYIAGQTKRAVNNRTLRAALDTKKDVLIGKYDALDDKAKASQVGRNLQAQINAADFDLENYDKEYKKLNDDIDKTQNDWQNKQQQGDSSVSSSSYGGNYLPIINQMASKYGVDPVAIQAIIKRESGGNPKSVNRANRNGTADYGIMQVNSNTRNPNSYNWQDPASNIEAGVAEFAGKLKQARGDYRRAFHLYNGLGAPSSVYADPVYSDYIRLKNGSSSKQQKTASLPASGALKSGIKYKITGN